MGLDRQMEVQESCSRLVTIPERMAAMRCLDCGHQWSDLEAATNQYPVACPGCGAHKTEPAYDVDGSLAPAGWMW